MFIGNWIVRFKASFIYLVAVAFTVTAHMNLLHFGQRWNDTIELVCWIILAFNNPVAGKLVERNWT